MTAQIGIRDLYNSMNKTADYGIQGYEVEKVYCDPLEQMKQRQLAKIKKGQKSRQYQTKRGNYLDDQAKLHKFCPGPGTYKTEMQWPEKEKLKRNVADKMTYIDEIIRHNKRNKIPAPGNYNVVKTLKQLDKQRKILAQKKPKPCDKTTFLDAVQFQSTQVPGVGNYNPRVRAKTQTSNSKMQKKPQDWRKIHTDQDKKKPQKTPDMRTYNPQPSFELFETMSKKKNGNSVMNKTQRFKTFEKNITLPPTKYSIIQKWRGKMDGKQKIQRHGYESLSKGMSKSVYY